LESFVTGHSVVSWLSPVCFRGFRNFFRKRNSLLRFSQHISIERTQLSAHGWSFAVVQSSPAECIVFQSSIFRS
jgi:hypothetical protein